MGLLNFLLLNGATLLVALGLTSRLQRRGLAEQWLAASVLYVAVAVLSATILGVTGHLRFAPLLASQAILAAAVAPFARWRSVAAMLCPGKALRRMETVQRLVLATCAVAYGYVVLVGIFFEPSAGDSLMYHLPLAAAYAREGRIVIPDLGLYWRADLWAYFPGNAYLLDQWWIQPFGNGVIVDLSQLPFAFAASVAAFVLARQLGATTRGAGWAGLLFLTTPIVINQSQTALVDVTSAFLFAAGLVFLMPPLTTAGLCLGGIAWGLTPGVKLTALASLPMGVLWMALAIHHAEATAASDRRRTYVAAAAALITATLLFSGYWFARNAWVTGSALFPITARGGDPIVWSNVLTYFPWWPLFDCSIYPPYFLYNYETGAGMQFAALGIPACLALTRHAWRRQRHDLSALALLPLALYGFWFLDVSTELHSFMRYVLPGLPVAYAAAGWMISNSQRAVWLIRLAALSCVASVFASLPRVTTFRSPSAALNGWRGVYSGETSLGRFGAMGDLGTQDFRGAWKYLDDLTDGRQIAVAHLAFAYPMLGAAYQHRLHFLPASTRTAWLDRVARENIQNVAVGEMRGPHSKITNRGAGIRLAMDVTITSDEYITVVHPLPAQQVKGIRLRYQTRAPSMAILGVNHFTQAFVLPRDEGGEFTVPWTGEVHSLELLMRPVDTRVLYAEAFLDVTSIEIIEPDGKATVLSGNWQYLGWPIECLWMEDDAAHFRPVAQASEFGGGQGLMQIYEVVRP